MASTHKHIRSGTANKRPTTAIADGQIALNTNLSSPGLFFKDSTGAEILKIGPVHVGATAPNVSPAGSAGNSTGEVWLDTSLTPVGVKIWNGSAFVNATPIGSTTVQGLLELATDAETQAGADTARAVTSASLQSKLSDSTSTTSNTTIASSTAVKAAYDLANAALPKAGGTVTGNLEIGTAGSLSFEGATADGFETTIAVVDPTADRTITLPNTTGTVVTTGDTGTVTSTMLLDGTILNEDINASASIAYSKLATLTSGNIVLGSSANVATSTAVTGDVTITNAGVTAIAAGVIVNADVNASAAIAGSKVAPDFGAQNIVTTGSSTAATFNPTGTTAPVTGVYSPGANRLGITTNSVERVEFGTSEVVFNDDAADYDFRIEGDTNSNLFFADASAEAVGIRTATPVSEFNVSVGNGGNITISNTNDAHSAGLAFGDTTSNSSGRITYDHSTNALAISTSGSEKLIVKSDGKVGIGTSSPSYLLDCKSTGATNVARFLTGSTNSSEVAQFGRSDQAVNLSIDYDGAGSMGIGTTTAHPFNLKTGAVTRATIDTSGRLGIGTTSPAQALDVNGNIQISGSIPRLLANMSGTQSSRFAIQNSTTNGNTRFFLYPNGTGNIAAINGINNSDPNASDYQAFDLAVIGTTDVRLSSSKTGSGSFLPITFYTSDTERARIDSSGRLLVGTSSSRQVNASIAALQLQIEGTTYQSSSMSLVTNQNVADGSYIVLGKSRGTSLNSSTIVNTNDSLGALWFCGADGTDLKRGATIEAFVDGTPGANDMPGRLVFSTTADGASSPTERMRITNGGEILFGTSTTTNGCKLALANTNATRKWGFGTIGTNTYFAVVDDTTGAGVQLNAGSTSWSTFSDERLKDNLIPIQDGLGKVSRLRAVTGRYKTDDTGMSRSFLIAQDVQAVLPEAVDVMSDNMGTLSLKYTEVIPLLVSALKESKERIEALEAKVAALENA